MKQRCNDRNSPDWANYGGRGITYCARWEFFGEFFRDMGERPEELTLDRIESDQGYYKGNCRWADRLTQTLNRREQTKPLSHSSTGIRGVSHVRRGNLYEAKVTRNGITVCLYKGKDFFEACCARKSWEARN